MYHTTESYRQAIESFAPQHITGRIVLADGREIVLDDTTLGGSPRYEKRCTEDEEIFMYGQMYTGTLELELLSATVSEYELYGAEVSLTFTVDGAEDEIPLGVWTVSQPERRDANSVQLKCVDCISRLDVPIDDNTVGLITIASRMRMVTEKTGVEFAQTPGEIMELIGGEAWGTAYARNCRQEVVNIAQIIGGFACANRYGRIEFRRFGTAPELTVTADMRHSARLSEYTYAVTGAGYADEYGHTTTLTWQRMAQVRAELMISGNDYIWDTYEDGEAASGEYDLAYVQSGGRAMPSVDRQYCYRLSGIAGELSKERIWTPGEVQYYGDPSIDLGDMIVLRDGVAGTSARFLVTGDYWQFRGAQTLISAGAGHTAAVQDGGGTYSSVTSGASGSSVRASVDLSGAIAVLTAEETGQQMPGGMTELCECWYSCRRQTVVTVYVTVVLSGSGRSEVHVLYNGVMQTVYAAEDLDGCRTVQLCLPLTSEQGTHAVTVEICGADAERVEMSITGQGITGELSDPTFPGDYSYADIGGEAELTGYSGTASRIRLPARLGGMPVTVIGGSSFTHNKHVDSVKIPEGVERIK